MVGGVIIITSSGPIIILIKVTQAIKCVLTFIYVIMVFNHRIMLHKPNYTDAKKM